MKMFSALLLQIEKNFFHVIKKIYIYLPVILELVGAVLEGVMTGAINKLIYKIYKIRNINNFSQQECSQWFDLIINYADGLFNVFEKISSI